MPKTAKRAEHSYGFKDLLKNVIKIESHASMAGLDWNVLKRPKRGPADSFFSVVNLGVLPPKANFQPRTFFLGGVVPPWYGVTEPIYHVCLGVLTTC